MLGGIDGLLDGVPLSGTQEVVRNLISPTVAAVVADDLEKACRAIRRRCELWGGPASPIVPGKPHGIDSMWATLLERADPDDVDAVGVEDVLIEKFARRRGGGPELAVAALASMGRARDTFRQVAVPVVNRDDPWYVSYLGTFGIWPEQPPAESLEFSGLRTDLSYDEVIPTEFEEVEASADDLVHRLVWGAKTWPAQAAMFGLNVEGRSYPLVGGSGGVLPGGHASADDVGPDIVVVYEPASVADLCLLWALRAAHGWPSGLPLGVPVNEAAAVLSDWQGNRAVRFGMLRDWALVSCSAQERLEKLAAPLRDCRLLRPQDLLLPPVRPSRQSAEVVLFTDGTARIATWAPSDMQAFPYRATRMPGMGLVVRLRPADSLLPPARALANEIQFQYSFRGGCFEVPAREPGTITKMRWPTGWTVLEAIARDLDLRVRRSRAGQAGETFLTRLGSIDELDLLRAPEITTLLERLVEPIGMNWFRTKLRALGTEDSGAAPVEEELGVPSPSEEAQRDATFEQVRASIPETTAAKAWLTWAERRGVLVRGVVVACPVCDARSWTTMRELQPPISCRGCGKVIDQPFPSDQLKFHYRASYPTLRLLSEDALPHLFALWWMRQLFSSSAKRPGRLVGAHPGVEFLDASGAVIGEADVVLLFTDGSLALGECKRTPAGLNEQELAKLERLAEAAKASWTFLAVPAPLGECPPIWQEAVQLSEDRPRFVLTAEHLYEKRPRGSLGENPFDLRDEPDCLRTRQEEFVTHFQSTLEWFTEWGHVEHEIRQQWEYEDSRSDESAD